VNRNLVAPKVMMPPTLTTLCLLAMIALRLVWPGPVAFPPLLIWAGLPVIILGIVVNIVADGQFKQARTPVNPLETPQRLLTTGVFGYTRNPMYLGFALVLAGVWLMLGTLPPLAGVLAFVLVADRGYIPYEEQKLLGLFGQDYRDYLGKVRRWL
jgi:protein-S-isoprenylcysteine O-methyltransferase Ste14